MVDMLPHLQSFINILSELKYLEKLKDVSDFEGFLYDIYEQTLEIACTDKLSFNFSNDEFQTFFRLKIRSMEARIRKMPNNPQEEVKS